MLNAALPKTKSPCESPHQPHAIASHRAQNGGGVTPTPFVSRHGFGGTGAWERRFATSLSSLSHVQAPVKSRHLERQSLCFHDPTLPGVVLRRFNRVTGAGAGGSQPEQTDIPKEG